MSDQQGGVFRGPGVVPGQGPGEAMPDVPKDVKPASAGDFQRILRERDNAAAQRANQPQQQPAPSARGRVASFSERLEASQQAPVGPNDPKPEKPAPGLHEGNQAKPANSQQPDPAASEQRADGSETDPSLEGSPQDGTQEPAEPDALDDMAALAKFREWEQAEFFPDELLSKLHEVQVDGRLEYVDGNELRQGYTRGGAARKMVAEAKQQMQVAQQHQQSMRQHFEEVRDPRNMLAIYERQGYGETLYEVAKLIAERDKGDRMQIRGAMIAEAQKLGIQLDMDGAWARDHRVQRVATEIEQRIKRQRVVDNENQRLQFERQQFEARQRAEQDEKQAQQDGAVLKRQVDQLRPLALKAYGIPSNQSNVQLFNVYLSRLIHAQGLENGNITRKMVMEAGQDTLDELNRQARAGQSGGEMTPEQWKAQQAGRQPQGRPLPANRMGLGGGKPNGQLAGQQRGRASDLEAKVRANRMRQ